MGPVGRPDRVDLVDCLVDVGVEQPRQRGRADRSVQRSAEAPPRQQDGRPSRRLSAPSGEQCFGNTRIVDGVYETSPAHVFEPVSTGGVDEPQIVQPVDERLIAHAEADEHPGQRLSGAPVLSDGAAHVVLRHQQAGGEGVGRPLTVVGRPKMVVDSQRIAVSAQDVAQLMSQREQRPRGGLIGVDHNEREIGVGDGDAQRRPGAAEALHHHIDAQAVLYGFGQVCQRVAPPPIRAELPDCPFGQAASAAQPRLARLLLRRLVDAGRGKRGTMCWPRAAIPPSGSPSRRRVPSLAPLPDLSLKRDPAQQGRVGVRLQARCRAWKRELLEVTVAGRLRRVNLRAVIRLGRRSP